jgi:hypothetical protein
MAIAVVFEVWAAINAVTRGQQTNNHDDQKHNHFIHSFD